MSGKTTYKKVCKLIDWLVAKEEASERVASVTVRNVLKGALVRHADNCGYDMDTKPSDYSLIVDEINNGNCRFTLTHYEARTLNRIVRKFKLNEKL